jgi:hypothetical protein
MLVGRCAHWNNATLNRVCLLLLCIFYVAGSKQNKSSVFESLQQQAHDYTDQIRTAVITSQSATLIAACPSLLLIICHLDPTSVTSHLSYRTGPY